MLNKTMLIGNIGSNPDIRYLPNGTAVAAVNVATSRKWKDKTSGERREETEWHRVVYFGRQAEVCGEYLKKGAKIYVEGRLKTRKWQDKNNNDRYTTEIIGEVMQMLSSKDAGDSHSAAYSAPPATDMPQPEDYDEDIPY